VTGLVIALVAVVLVLAVALVFARAATKRAADRAALDLAHAMADEIKRKVAAQRAEIDRQTVANTSKLPALSDAELERELNK
jgi:hypothetical protein